MQNTVKENKIIKNQRKSKNWNYKNIRFKIQHMHYGIKWYCLRGMRLFSDFEVISTVLFMFFSKYKWNKFCQMKTASTKWTPKNWEVRGTVSFTQKTNAIYYRHIVILPSFCGFRRWFVPRY